MPGQLDGPRQPNYPFESHTIRSDWAEMDTVVSHLLESNGVRKLSLVGWSDASHLESEPVLDESSD